MKYAISGYVDGTVLLTEENGSIGANQGKRYDRISPQEAAEITKDSPVSILNGGDAIGQFINSRNELTK